MAPDSKRPTAMGQMWRATSNIPVPKSGWPSAIRRGLMVALLVAIGVATGHLPEGALAGIGALNIGLVDGAVPRRTLTKAIVWSAVAVTILAFAASILAGSWWILPLLVILAFIHGSIAGAGMVALNASLMSLVSALVFSNDPGNFQSALHTATWVMIGAALAGASSLIAWRYEREAQIRRSFAIVIHYLRSLALETSHPQTAHLDAARAESDAESTVTGARLSPGQNARYAELLTQLNWTRICLTNWLRVGDPTPTQRYAVAGILEQVDSDVRHTLRSPHALAALETAIVIDDRSPRDSGRTWDILVAQLNALLAAGEMFASDTPASQTEWQAGLGGSVADRADQARSRSEQLHSVAALFRPGTATFHNGLRLALAIGIAEGLTLGLNIPRGYWIGITVAFIIKPDFATTVTRGALRIAGTLAGVLVVTLLIDTTSDPGWLTVLILAISTPGVMRWMSGNYGFAAFFVTTTVLVLVEASGGEVSTLELRMENTLIGVVISIAVYLLWPSWKGDELPKLLRTALHTQRAWTVSVLNAMDNPADYDRAEIRELGTASRNAVLVARPAAEGALLEPHRADADPAAALSLLDACQHAAEATLALEVHAAAASEQHPPGAAGTPGSAVTAHTWDSSALRRQLDTDFSRANAALLTPGRGVETVRSDPAADDLALDGPGVNSAGDPVTDRALGLLVAAADAAAAAARCI